MKLFYKKEHRWIKKYQSNVNKKKAGATILISLKMEFKVKGTTQIKENNVTEFQYERTKGMDKGQYLNR